MDSLDVFQIRENRDVLRMLLRQIQSPMGIIPFIGAGMSVSFGFPTWKDFLLTQAGLADLKEEVGTLLTDWKYEEAAETLRTVRGDLRFNDTLAGCFDRDLTIADTAHAALARVPFLSTGPVITTNFDTVLEHIFQRAGRPFDRVILGRRVDDAPSQLALNRRLLVKLHGECAFPQDRVLTLSEYAAAYGAAEEGLINLSLPLPNLLKIVIESRPLLFLGCSLANDRTMRVVNAVARGFGTIAHYAIIPLPRLPAELLVRDRFLADHGIRPIWYPAGQHDAVAALLDHLIAVSSTNASNEAESVDVKQQKSVTTAETLKEELEDADCDAEFLNFTEAELVRRTRHSRIYRLSRATGNDRLVKFTKKDVISIDALSRISGQSIEFDEHGLRTTVALPLWVNITRDEVIEMLPFCEGIPLELVRLRSPSGFQGDLLAKIFNALVTCAHYLHEMGVLHRDITPSNVLLSSDGRFVKIALIDLSFACMLEKSGEVAVSSGFFTAPEQTAASSVPASDYYSIAATCFFLATGHSANTSDQKLFEADLTSLDFGDYSPRGYYPPVDVDIYDDRDRSRALIRALLAPNPGDRPSDLWTLLLSTPSRAMVKESPIIGILDFEKYGVATIDSRGVYRVVPPNAEGRVDSELLNRIRDRKLMAFLRKRQSDVGGPA